ncbi:MAG: extracellular solute-binding protein [Caldilineaceae bacterium]|jgi:ABC-type glycerol-3-phosphate transport system substrate-binding protein|nr:extracellular solute-binding protein [Caldilineaceae bacterium]
MKTRIYTLLALLIIGAMALSACTLPAAAPAGAGGESAAGDQPIELLYMTHNHAQSIPVNEAAIAEFQESHPNVTITFDNAPHSNYEQKILTAFAGGEGPDVFWAGDWMIPQFVKNGIVAPVNPTAFGVQTQDEFVDLYDAGSLDAFTVDGKVYTGGVSEYNTFSLIYDKDDFAEAGIEPLSKETPITWEELSDIAAKLTKKDGDKVVRIGLEWPFQTPIWTVLVQEPMLRQLGGELINAETGMPDFTQEPMVKVMEYVQSLRQAGAIDPALDQNLLDDLVNDRASIIIGGPWAAKPLNDLDPNLNWDTAPLPQFADAVDRVTTLYAWAWFVSAKSSPEEQEAAWEFVNLLTSKQQQWWDEVGYVQARKANIDGMTLPEYYAQSDPRLATIFADYPFGKSEFRSPQYFELSDIWTRAQDRVLQGEDVMTVLQEAQAQAEQAVAQ